MHQNYYEDRLSADRLQQCYAIAPPRVRRYFDAEIRHVVGRINPAETVLDLGCGYGRVMPELAEKAKLVVGVDTSLASLRRAEQHFRTIPNCRRVQSNAVCMGLRDGAFDWVVCIQNGISAFHVDQRRLVAESIRVTRPGGRILFSSYSTRFWDARLEWFRLQSEQGLIGEIDAGATRNGVIVCKDGFTATTVGPEAFLSLASQFDVDASIVEVDESSVFCEMVVR